MDNNCSCTLSSLFSTNLYNNASILILDISNKCGTSGCNQICTNIVDSYICSCYNGYVLDADGHSCNGKVYIAHATYVTTASSQMLTSVVKVLMVVINSV